MAKVLEALIAKGRRVRRPREQKEVAFGLADLSTHEELHERIVKKGGCKSLIQLLMKSSDQEAQRFSALAIANIASAVFNRIAMVQDDVLQNIIAYINNDDSDLIGRQVRQTDDDAGTHARTRTHAQHRGHTGRGRIGRQAQATTKTTDNTDKTDKTDTTTNQPY